MVSHAYVTVPDVLNELKPALKGLKFLFSPVTGLWYGPEDSPLILDQYLPTAEIIKLCSSAPVPIIPVRPSASYVGVGPVYQSSTDTLVRILRQFRGLFSDRTCCD